MKQFNLLFALAQACFGEINHGVPFKVLKSTRKDYINPGFLARLLFQGKQICTASMLRPAFFVTPASCIVSTHLPLFTLVTNSWDGQVDELRKHPMFGIVDGMDIAILKSNSHAIHHNYISLAEQKETKIRLLVGWKLSTPSEISTSKSFNCPSSFFPGTPVMNPPAIVAFLTTSYNQTTLIKHHRLWIEATYQKMFLETIPTFTN
ncbi:hypothetical protein DSO57_1036966 [Entomophthora muscae]|uniref:Uncharacterized protein n=1 Tax=Entomophthora muscae TaxID=34485 RepID=A0ACC2SC69_9FUNG|nr:hypothetical protein DSO57_1036966 [Entomophthora muscae]